MAADADTYKDTYKDTEKDTHKEEDVTAAADTPSSEPKP